MQSILVIDDEAGIRSALKDILEDEKYKVFLAEDGIQGLETLKEERIDLVILDLWLPKMGGIDVLGEIKKRDADLEVIIISGHGNIDLAVKAVKLGAFDFLEKPLSLDRVITVTRNALAIGTLKRENIRLKKGLDASGEEMIGSGPQMAAIHQVIEQAAATDARVLITGENGTGKELVAREIHRKSARAAYPFIEVNCAAIPDTLIESELFGHERGAFTDAITRRKGKFELAHKGTIFLDEVADMSLSAQSKVLRAIQELKFERVGGEESITVDLRIIAATNKIIPDEIAANRFREDLFFRLNVVPIEMPALRDRGNDIVELARYFIKEYSQRQDLGLKELSEEAQTALREYSWPGNVRELKNLMERISVMSDEPVVSKETLLHFVGNQESAKGERSLVEEEFALLKLGDARDLFEKNYILQKLGENGYNISRTAEAIGVYPSSLHAKIKKFGIQTDK